MEYRHRRYVFAVGLSGHSSSFPALRLVLVVLVLPEGIGICCHVTQIVYVAATFCGEMESRLVTWIFCVVGICDVAMICHVTWIFCDVAMTCHVTRIYCDVTSIGHVTWTFCDGAMSRHVTHVTWIFCEMEIFRELETFLETFLASEMENSIGILCLFAVLALVNRSESYRSAVSPAAHHPTLPGIYWAIRCDFSTIFHFLESLVVQFPLFLR